MNIVYKSYILTNITGTTSFYSGSSSAITSDIYIPSGFTLTLNQFDKTTITRIDIIDNIINFIDDGTNKYTLNILIVDSGNTYQTIISPGEYCIKISNNLVIQYFTLIVYDSYIPIESNESNNSDTGNTYSAVELIPTILYNYSISGTSWNGGDIVTPYNVFLPLIHNNSTGWTSESLKDLFIAGLIDSSGTTIPTAELNLNIFKNTSSIDSILESGIYDIKILYTDYFNNSVINYISNMIVNDEPPIIIYNTYVLNYNLTGNTSYFSGSSSAITSDIYISSGFTLKLENNIIDRISIIDNIIKYAYDIFDVNINKYMIDVLIVDSGNTYSSINKSGNYCIKFILYNKNNIKETDYFIMNVVDNVDNYLNGYWQNNIVWIDYSIILLPNIIEDNNLITKSYPTILYNYPISGTSWNGGDIVSPYNIFLHLVHDNITGWTLETLRDLFIEGLIDSSGTTIPTTELNLTLFKEGTIIKLTEITEFGIYTIKISYTDYFNNSVINYISNIIVNDEQPVIVYKPYVLNYNLTGNTSYFSGSSSAITSDIYIPSGFTLNLNGFDYNIINRLDIINNIVQYAYDNIDVDINRYMIDVLIFGQHDDNYAIIYDNVTKPGEYCVKLSLKNKNNINIIYYFIMTVVYDVSVYSEGYWQDNKVWIDSTLWLDHPIIPKR